MTLDPIIAGNFRFWRASPSPMSAGLALVKARTDAAAGIRRSERPNVAALASYQNKPDARGGRWIENPEAAGLRFVGWSDELTDGRGRGHNGWFLYPEGDPAELARGCVYRLPARRGKGAVYVEAIRTGEYLGRNDWRDMGEDGSAHIFLNCQHIGHGMVPADSDHYGAHRDAARGADREAEIYAQAEREYQEAWQAGQRAAEYVEEATESRKKARALVAAFRTSLAGFCAIPMPAIQRNLFRDAIRRHIRDAIRANEKAAERKEMFGDTDAFKEAFGEGAN